MNYNTVEFLTSFGRPDQLPPSDRGEIVFAGRSNVGKSSLINKLFNRKSLARVSSTPGKTVTINFFTGGDIYFVDLPGYGYARVSGGEKERWAELMEHYLSDADRDIRIVFCLIDIRHAPTEDDIMMIDFLIDSELPFVVVLTKADKLSRPQLAKRLAEIELPCVEQITMIPFSAVNGMGVTEIRAIIDQIEADGKEETEAILQNVNDITEE
ncbi:MAG: ribosome biogenesis GTP-binding protein YihA/YsxC [Angelakisella sp.]